MKNLNNINRPSISLIGRKGETLVITLNLQSITDEKIQSGNSEDGVLRRIVLGRGLQYYMSGNEKFAAGSGLLMKLRDAANELQLISNNVYVTGRFMQHEFKAGINDFDRIMMQVIAYVKLVEGGTEELKDISGVDIGEIEKLFTRPRRRNHDLKMIVFRLLL